MAPALSPGPQGREDDESEWEFEYSTTETETYYVTLDLTTADFVDRQQKTVAHGRSSGKLIDGNANGDDDEDGQDQQVEEFESGPKEAHFKSDFGLGDDVQILELHSANPVISYRGHVYEGQWSENIGTELLLTQHDEESNLPILRELEEDVDLLAASSARIVVTEKKFVPRKRGTKRRRAEDMFDVRSEASSDEDVVPEPEPGTGLQRAEQGDFLARFIGLKKRMGETDKVTVIAQETDLTRNLTRRRPAKGAHGHRIGRPRRSDLRKLLGLTGTNEPDDLNGNPTEDEENRNGAEHEYDDLNRNSIMMDVDEDQGQDEGSGDSSDGDEGDEDSEDSTREDSTGDSDSSRDESDEGEYDNEPINPIDVMGVDSSGW